MRNRTRIPGKSGETRQEERGESPWLRDAFSKRPKALQKLRRWKKRRTVRPHFGLICWCARLASWLAPLISPRHSERFSVEISGLWQIACSQLWDYWLPPDGFCRFRSEGGQPSSVKISTLTNWSPAHIPARRQINFHGQPLAALRIVIDFPCQSIFTPAYQNGHWLWRQYPGDSVAPRLLNCKSDQTL